MWGPSVVLAIVLAGVMTAHGHAQEASAVPLMRVAGEITVTATRTPRRLDDVPASVSTITAEEIENNLSADIKDLVRFEPGVSVRTNPPRFTAAFSSTGRDGNSGFNIRGLEGNRVLIQVDGIRLPDAFSFGPQAVGRGDYVELDLLKSVEILRGPASALYGSDGVAGAVSFVTKDPDDLIAADRNVGVRLRAAYASSDESWAESALVAGRAGPWQALVAYTRRDGDEQETHGDNAALDLTRTAANPQDAASNAVLGKLVFAPAEHNRFRLIAEFQDQAIESEVFSARSIPPLVATSTLDLDAQDTSQRIRISLDQRYQSEGDALVDRVFWAFYYQQSKTRQFSAEDRNAAPDRTRESTFDNSVYGLTAELESKFQLGVPQRLLYGGDVSTTHQTGLRDGTVPPAGETFPTRAFPTTNYLLAGLYIQDEIELAGGALTLFPALRYDYYGLDPKPDAAFPGATAGQSDSNLSPKFGLVYWPFDRFGLFGNYVQGFKAPAPSQVNNGFQNLLANYQSIPNPNLKPETSETIEGGVRLRRVHAVGAQWSASTSLFSGEYRDFIEQVQIGGTFSPVDPAIFQFVNLGSVKITGAEGKIEADWPWGLGAQLSVSYAHGQQKAGGVSSPLASIEPIKLVAGLSYRDPQGRFGGQLAATHSEGKDASRAGVVCAPSCFLPPSFTILDATAYWHITEHAALRAGVFNVTDETYWWWGDVRGLASGTGTEDGYTQPGRNFSASLTLRF